MAFMVCRPVFGAMVCRVCLIHHIPYIRGSGGGGPERAGPHGHLPQLPREAAHRGSLPELAGHEAGGGADERRCGRHVHHRPPANGKGGPRHRDLRLVHVERRQRGGGQAGEEEAGGVAARIQQKLLVPVRLRGKTL
eukprot:1185967-Prorocentrum_minimum.AAC.1